MTTITLPDDLDAPLAEQANKKGTTPELLAGDILRQVLAPPPPQENGNESGGSLYDLLQDVIGSVSSGGRETMYVDCGEKFTDGLVEKKSQGRL